MLPTSQPQELDQTQLTTESPWDQDTHELPLVVLVQEGKAAPNEAMTLDVGKTSKQDHFQHARQGTHVDVVLGGAVQNMTLQFAR